MASAIPFLFHHQCMSRPIFFLLFTGAFDEDLCVLIRSTEKEKNMRPGEETMGKKQEIGLGRVK